MIKPKAIFWDMDGTLTDSEPLWGEATYALSERLGKRITPELRQQTVGSTFNNTLEICARHAGVTLAPGDYEIHRQWLFRRVKDSFSARLEVFPGMRDLLAELKADGIQMVVATNTQRDVADAAIDAIGRSFFVDTICGDEVERGKPAPDIYEEAARRVGYSPGDCLVFEDSAAGMRAALDAGCVVIGLPEHDGVDVPQGVTPIDRLHDSAHLAPAVARDVYAWFEKLYAV